MISFSQKRGKMKLRICFWSIVLHFLAVMCFLGSGAREMAREELMVAPKIPMDDLAERVNVLQLHSMDGREEKNGKEMEMEMEDNRLHDHDHKRGDDETRKREDAENIHVHDHGHSSPSSHMHKHGHLNPSDTAFFNEKDMKSGKTLLIYFLKEEDPASHPPPPPLLPKEEADSIPFSSAHLPYLLELFSFSPGSPEAKVVEDALGYCETEPSKGETKFCATSKGSMLDFVGNIFGELDSNYFRALSTPYLKKSDTTDLLQNYTILEEPKIKEIPAPKKVACHPMPYPYLIFYCHSQLSSKLFEVPLQGQNGDRVDALAVCHLDTSDWSPDHDSFRVLGTGPGTPVCHFLPANSLMWIPRPNLD